MEGELERKDAENGERLAAGDKEVGRKASEDAAQLAEKAADGLLDDAERANSGFKERRAAVKDEMSKVTKEWTERVAPGVLPDIVERALRDLEGK